MTSVHDTWKIHLAAVIFTLLSIALCRGAGPGGCKITGQSAGAPQGDGPDKEKLKKLCMDLNIAEYVIFAGAQRQDDIKDYMSIADIFISMNVYGSLNNSLFEAMICGKTVIALNKGTIKELIENRKNGILVEEGEIAKLPEIMNEILMNTQLREEIGKNAQKYMLENWQSWDERVAYEVDLIEKLISQ